MFRSRPLAILQYKSRKRFSGSSWLQEPFASKCRWGHKSRSRLTPENLARASVHLRKVADPPIKQKTHCKSGASYLASSNSPSSSFLHIIFPPQDVSLCRHTHAASIAYDAQSGRSRPGTVVRTYRCKPHRKTASSTDIHGVESV